MKMPSRTAPATPVRADETVTALGVDRDVSRLGRDAVQPRPHGRIPIDVPAALVRHMRVGVERDVGEREAVADERLAVPKVAVERREDAVAGYPAVRTWLNRVAA